MNEAVSTSTEESPFAQNLKSKSIWMRLFFMLAVTFLYSVSRIVVGTVVVLQFLWVLFTGQANERLKVFGKSLASYTNQIILYLSFNTEERPFPFDMDWPSS